MLVQMGPIMTLYNLVTRHRNLSQTFFSLPEWQLKKTQQSYQRGKGSITGRKVVKEREISRGADAAAAFCDINKAAMSFSKPGKLFHMQH